MENFEKTFIKFCERNKKQNKNNIFFHFQGLQTREPRGNVGLSLASFWDLPGVGAEARRLPNASE
jgi:hypothetical protein